MKKTLMAIIATSIVVLAFPAAAGQWMQDSFGWWYQNDDGSYAKSQWQTINGAYYYFDENGYMLTNAFTPDGYYVGPDGVLVQNMPTQTAQNGQSANSAQATQEAQAVQDTQTVKAAQEAQVAQAAKAAQEAQAAQAAKAAQEAQAAQAAKAAQEAPSAQTAQTASQSGTVFQRQDVSDAAIESIKTYDDYLNMYLKIINNYMADYEAALKGSGLYDEKSFRELKAEMDTAYEEQVKMYGAMRYVPLIGKNELVTFLKSYRDSLKATTDAYAGIIKSSIDSYDNMMKAMENSYDNILKSSGNSNSYDSAMKSAADSYDSIMKSTADSYNSMLKSTENSYDSMMKSVENSYNNMLKSASLR